MSFHAFDIVIIGAGPSGCMAAIGAKQQHPDASVCIVDEITHPSHKIGEALLTGTILTLTRAGLDKDIFDAGFHKKIGAAYLWGKNAQKGKPWYVNYPQDNAAERGFSKLFMDNGERWTIHVPRHKFDRILLDKAISLGVIHLNYNVYSVVIKDNNILRAKIGEDELLMGRRWIDASGQGAVVSKELKQRKKIKNPRAVRYGYVDDIDWDIAEANGFSKHRTNIVSCASGWAWLIHLGNASEGESPNDITSVGFVMHPKNAKALTFENALEKFTVLKDAFGKTSSEFLNYTGESKIDDWYCHPHYSYMSKSLHGGNWALAGDAAGFIDPILSQGVSLAVHYGYERGIAAASAIQSGIDLNSKITDEYYTELALLNEVCEIWYDNDKTEHDWKLRVQKVGKKFFDISIDNHEVAFRLFTNLEHVRSDLSSFSSCQMKAMEENLGKA